MDIRPKVAIEILEGRGINFDKQKVQTRIQANLINIKNCLEKLELKYLKED